MRLWFPKAKDGSLSKANIHEQRTTLPLLNKIGGMATEAATNSPGARHPRNKRKLIGQKPPLRPKHSASGECHERTVTMWKLVGPEIGPLAANLLGRPPVSRSFTQRQAGLAW
jgi:hypothetical protein